MAISRDAEETVVSTGPRREQLQPTLPRGGTVPSSYNRGPDGSDQCAAAIAAAAGLEECQRREFGDREAEGEERARGKARSPAEHDQQRKIPDWRGGDAS